MSIRSTYSDGAPVVAFRVARASGEVLAERLADDVFYPASTVKLAVLAAVGRLLETGEVSLDQPLISRDTFVSDIAGTPDYRLVPDDVDHGMAPSGAPMPLAEVVERMVVVSSNEATNLLYELIGFDAVNAVFADAGATASKVSRKFGDFAAAAAHGPGGGNLTTAGDLAALMGALVSGRLAGPQWTGWAIDMLSRQEYPAITKELPDGVPWGSKSGSVDAIRHDVAFIGEPGPDALIVAVCTRGYQEDDSREAVTAIGSLAFALAQ
ncbi:serine hydrolase [Nakamurella lactea]|uniref:serine hydrolase n=1 Tax=Nakamurella lactea TaxID=459515 RepID=UPI00041634EB|nr:serine hydrolase [Nakamurella lactea]